MAFFMLNLVCVGKMLAAKPSSDHRCPPLSKAVISLDHPIVAQLNKQYLTEGSVKYREEKYRRQSITLNTVWADPNTKVTSLVKIGNYGLARWGRQQWIVLYFQKNQLRLNGSDLIGHFEDTCINCLDAAAAVESAEVILKRHDVADADIKCLGWLETEIFWRLYGKNGLT
jgi:hypothetical protein